VLALCQHTEWSQVNVCVRASCVRFAEGEEALRALEGRLALADFSTSQALERLPLAERWIVSRLHQVRRWAGLGWVELSWGCVVLSPPLVES